MFRNTIYFRKKKQKTKVETKENAQNNSCNYSCSHENPNISLPLNIFHVKKSFYYNVIIHKHRY